MESFEIIAFVELAFLNRHAITGIERGELEILGRIRVTEHGLHEVIESATGLNDRL